MQRAASHMVPPRSSRCRPSLSALHRGWARRTRDRDEKRSRSRSQERKREKDLIGKGRVQMQAPRASKSPQPSQRC
jgi:hypothetical protein